MREVRIRHGRARVDRPAAAVHRVVDEVERAVTVVMPVAVEADRDVGMRRGAAVGLLPGEVIGLAHVEIEIDRVERDDRRQQRRWARAAPAAAHQVAGRDEMRADPPGERRGDTRELEVEPRVHDGRLGGVDGGLLAALVGGTLVHGFRRAELGSLELLRPPELRLGQRLLGLRGLQLCDALVEPDLERPRVDGEEQIALVHDLPVLERDRGQDAADLRPQFDAIHRGELAEKAAAGLHRPLQRQADGHLRRRGRRGGRVFASPPGALTRHSGQCCHDHGEAECAPPSRVAIASAAASGDAGAFGDVKVGQGEIVHVPDPQFVILRMVRLPRFVVGVGGEAAGRHATVGSDRLRLGAGRVP